MRNAPRSRRNSPSRAISIPLVDSGRDSPRPDAGRAPRRDRADDPSDIATEPKPFATLRPCVRRSSTSTRAVASRWHYRQRHRALPSPGRARPAGRQFCIVADEIDTADLAVAVDDDLRGNERYMTSTLPVRSASASVTLASYLAWIGQIGMQLVLPAQTRRFYTAASSAAGVGAIAQSMFCRP